VKIVYYKIRHEEGLTMRKVIKWIGIVLGGLVGVLVVAIIILLVYGQLSFKTAYNNRPLYAVNVDYSPEKVARGQYLLENVMACGGACHSPEDGPPYSGVADELSLGPAFVYFAAPNLTPDVETGLGGWSDAEIARAIREGIDRDGNALEVMPAFNYHVMSDADIAAVIAYLRSLPPVDKEIPEFNANALGKVLLALNLFMPEPVGAPITSVQYTPPVDTIEYGAYLTSISACRDCHKTNLKGGEIPQGGMHAPDLTMSGNLKSWSESDFLIAMQTGKLPEGRSMAPQMPYMEYGRMEEGDLLAIFAFLKSLPGEQ
jgi:mono/diheme cytochrome c family protein